MQPPLPDALRDQLLSDAAARFGTPLYAYFTDVIEERLAALQAAFGRWFHLSFAVKSNPNPALLDWMKGRLDHLDISSGGELEHALAAGWQPDRISFTGPAKREAELRAAIGAKIGGLVVESLREARLADAIAAEMGRVQPILLRIAPDRVPKGFGDQMAGRPSAFGIDIEDLPETLPLIVGLTHLRIVGLHIYSGTQSLKPEAICENWRIFIEIFSRVSADLNLAPQQLIFGSGLGIPYHPGDQALDLSFIAAEIGPDLDRLKADPRMAQTEFVLELGRHIVGPAGYFVTRVLSVKQSRGSRIAICDGGLNVNLAASGNFGMVIRRNYVMHRVGISDAPEEKHDISGPLCTSIDKLGGAVMLPRLDEGDLIAVHNGGAYGPTASPVHFISHPLPNEVLVTGGQIIDATWIGRG